MWASLSNPSFARMLRKTLPRAVCPAAQLQAARWVVYLALSERSAQRTSAAHNAAQVDSTTIPIIRPNGRPFKLQRPDLGKERSAVWNVLVAIFYLAFAALR